MMELILSLIVFFSSFCLIFAILSQSGTSCGTRRKLPEVARWVFIYFGVHLLLNGCSLRMGWATHKKEGGLKFIRLQFYL